MASTPEGKMKKKVDAVLDEFGLWYFAPQSGIYGRAGIPDRIAILPGGKLFGIEVKAPGAKRGVTELQRKTLQAIIDAGGEAWVVDSEERLQGMRAFIKLCYERKH